MEQFISVIYGIILMFAAARGTSPEDQMRLHAVAQDVWNEASSATVIPIEGEAGVEATALALVAVAGHESGFWSKVQDCSACFRGSQWCDKGRSVSLYQLHEGTRLWGEHTREQICADNAIATRLALRILARRRGAHTPHALFRAMGGRREAAAEMAGMYATATRKAGIFVSYSGGVMTAAWMKPRTPVAPHQP